MRFEIFSGPGGVVSPEWISALTALVAVILGPLITIVVARWQLRSAKETTLQQIRSASEVASAQIRSVGETAAMQVRANLVSANRQVWINTVRDTVAEAQTALLMAYVARETNIEVDVIAKLERATFLIRKLEMLINPAEDDSNAVVDDLKSLIDPLTGNSKLSEAEINELHGRIVSQTQAILKREWEVVKRAE